MERPLAHLQLSRDAGIAGSETKPEYGMSAGIAAQTVTTNRSFAGK
jgi:hypothetical protein